MQTQPKRWKRGDVGPDGRVFWRYRPSYKDRKQWVTSAKFEENKAKHRECNTIYSAKPENKAKMREYQAKHHAKPETKAKKRECDAKRKAKPEAKAKQREYWAKYYQDQIAHKDACNMMQAMDAVKQLIESR